ncbi:MAG TPA: DUF4331 family protein [Fimbriimonadaceae bacterium]|nr:DUF4331 family protein [Fimbriimonadaceae bacterium]
MGDDEPMNRFLLLTIVGLTVTGCGGSNNGNAPQVYAQVDRTGRPGVLTLFSTVTGGQHKTEDTSCVCTDNTIFKPEISAFMTTAAGRDAATATAASNLLAPNMLFADMSSSATTAGYMGIESGGKVGTSFGGRALTDDVMASILGIAFGNSLASFGLVADDGKEIPALTDDHVGSGDKHFMATFPYLGPPD